MSFQVLWTVSVLLLLALAGWVGRQVNMGQPRQVAGNLSYSKSTFGIFIDSRERFSLNRFQLLMWTVLILSTLLALFFTSGLEDAFDIPPHLFSLMGISVGSAVVSGAVKDGKNQNRKEEITGGIGFHGVNQTADSTHNVTDPHFGQVFLEEEGLGAARQIVSVTKFQNFIFTLALGVCYVVLTWAEGKYPDFDEPILWLVGISHAGYVGGKLPNKP